MLCLKLWLNFLAKFSSALADRTTLYISLIHRFLLLTVCCTIRYTILLDVMLYSLVWIYCHVIVTCCLHLQGIGVYHVVDATGYVLQNIAKFLPDHTVSHSRRQYSLGDVAIRSQNVTVYWSRSTANDDHDFIPYGTGAAIWIKRQNKADHLPRAWPNSVAFTCTVLLGLCRDETRASQYFVIDMCAYVGWGTVN